MRAPRFVSRFVVLTWLCAGFFAIDRANANPPDLALTEQVKSIERAFAATMARRDLSSFAKFLSAQAVFFSDRGALRGKDAVVQAWSRYFQGSSAPFSWEPERVEVIDSGTLALSSGPVRDAAGKQIANFNSIWARESDGQWRIIFDKGQAVCATPTAATPAATVDVPPDLEAYVGAALKTWRAPGMAIAMVKSGRVILARGFGQRELGGNAPVDAHTRFAIASLTKAFTAAAAGQQVLAHKLSWDEPIAGKLPGFALRDARVSAEITLRDVLSHRSGLDDGAELLWQGTGYDQNEILTRLRGVGQAAPLRTQFSYSNVLYLAAGRLVAQSAGQPWAEIIQKRFLEPLEMRDSGLGIPRAADGNFARPHSEREGVMRVIKPRDVENIAPAAAVFSSAADLSRWLLLLLGRGEVEGRRVLDPRVVDTVLTPQMLVGLAPWQKTLYPESNFLAQGMGFMLQDYRGRLVAWGTGGIDGYSCSLALLPKEQLGVVVLTNVPWTGLPEGMVYWLIDKYLGAPNKDWSALRLALSLQSRGRRADAQKAKEGRRESTSWPLPPTQFVGQYRSALLGDAVIETGMESNTLKLRIAKALNAVLEPWRPGVLRLRFSDPEIDPELCTYTVGPEGVRSLSLGEWGTFERFPASPPLAGGGGGNAE